MLAHSPLGGQGLISELCISCVHSVWYQQFVGLLDFSMNPEPLQNPLLQIQIKSVSEIVARGLYPPFQSLENLHFLYFLVAQP